MEKHRPYVGVICCNVFIPHRSLTASFQFFACIIIEDEIKADAPAAIKLLKSAGIRKTVMLTGDADAVGKKVAGQLHLDQVYTELLPADKVDRVESLLKAEKRKRYAGLSWGRYQ